jgi:hypothetical protein
LHGSSDPDIKENDCNALSFISAMLYIVGEQWKIYKKSTSS